MKLKFHEQETGFSCGAAVIRMALEHFGIKKSEKELVKSLKTSKVFGTKREMITKFVEKLKIDYYEGGGASVNDLKYYSRRGYVVVVVYFIFSQKIGHYAIFDKATEDYVYLTDPYFGPGHRMAVSYFRKAWNKAANHDKEHRWFLALKKK